MIVFDRVPTFVVVGATSVVAMQWEAGDTATIGRIDVEVEVMWPGNKPQTFRPATGVTIAEDFDHV